MDIVRRQIERRRVANHLGIEHIAALHVAQANAFARERQIFVPKEIAHPRIAIENILGRLAIGRL